MCVNESDQRTAAELADRCSTVRMQSDSCCHVTSGDLWAAMKGREDMSVSTGISIYSVSAAYQIDLNLTLIAVVLDRTVRIHISSLSAENNIDSKTDKFIIKM